MGLIMAVLDGLTEVAQWAGKTVSKGVKAVAPYAKKGVSSLAAWIGEHTSETRIELKPVNISLVAPSGFGKTTLISTIMKEIDLTLQKTDKERTYELAARPKSEEDDKRLEENNRMKNNKRELIQPFCMMDIPGGWINPENRIGKDVQSQWENFEKHLHESRILWIPIDSVALMEARTTKERDLQAKLMDVTDVANLVVEWAKYRTNDEESCVCFIPLKCETYKILDEENSDFRKKFDDMFATVEHELGKAKGDANIKMFYTPVYTIGCIRKVNSAWGENIWVNRSTGKEVFSAEEARTAEVNGDAMAQKTIFSAEYKITGTHRDIQGADLLLSKVYEYAYNQIRAMEEYDEALLKASGFIEKKKAEMGIKAIKTALEPAVKEFASKTSKASELEEIPFKA